MNYSKIYIIFFSIIIGLIVSSQLLIQSHLQNQEAYTHIINLSGLQRHNSRAIALNSLKVISLDSTKLSYSQKEENRQLLARFEKIHLGLQFGDSDLKLPGNNSKEVQVLFKKISPLYNTINSNFQLITNPAIDWKTRRIAYDELSQQVSPFIETMNGITEQYDKEAKEKIHQLQYYELLLALLTVLTIILEVMLIIKPVLKHYHDKSFDLGQHNEQLEKKNKQILKQNEQLYYYNEELSKAKEDAEVAMMEKAMFLSNMSHEIRTPMNAVLGITNIMLDDSPRTDQLENLKTLKFSAENLLTILNDILDFNKIEAGKIKIEKISFYLKEIIDNIRRSLNPQLEKKNIQLEINLDKRLPDGMVGDPVRLSQILFNLLGNALKFTDKGKIQLNVNLQKIENNNAYVYFEVKDTGIGIPGEKLDTIFESFTQANSNTTRLYGGTGLGLAICKKLVELQGGDIGVNSEVGKGSAFFFNITFPISFDSKEKTQKNKAEKIKTLFNDGQKILIVEDNKINQMVIAKFLKKWEVKYDIAENGKKAVEKVEENDYSLVLMDLQMPEMDGYEATQIIRVMEDGKYNHLPIIALSASAMLEIREKAFEVGMNEYVCKPFKPDELYYAMAKYMN